jgi:hypothetical protein
MLCFDIGANIGRWTTAHKNKFDKLVCNEAAPTVLDKLLLNTNELKLGLSKLYLCVNYAVK